MSTALDNHLLDQLEGRVTGSVLAPDDAGYDAARAGAQRPGRPQAGGDRPLPERPRRRRGACVRPKRWVRGVGQERRTQRRRPRRHRRRRDDRPRRDEEHHHRSRARHGDRAGRRDLERAQRAPFTAFRDQVRRPLPSIPAIHRTTPPETSSAWGASGCPGSKNAIAATSCGPAQRCSLGHDPSGNRRTLVGLLL